MMLLSAIAAVLLAVVAKRRIGAARPKNRARPDTPHAEAQEAPAAGTIEGKEYETYVLRSKILQPAAQQVERVQSDGYGTDV